jgi:hypothetical protein
MMVRQQTNEIKALLFFFVNAVMNDSIGRKHQIRSQLSAIGHPLVGDRK